MNYNVTNRNELSESLALVPRTFLNEMLEKQDRIINLLENSTSSEIPGDYISESEAMKLLNRKTTWFWKMRTSKKLAFTKVGNANLYARADIQRLLDDNRSEAVRK